MLVELSLIKEDWIEGFAARQIDYNVKDKVIRIECSKQIDMLNAYGDVNSLGYWIYVVPMDNVNTLICW
jgi:hypothetical protein